MKYLDPRCLAAAFLLRTSILARLSARCWGWRCCGRAGLGTSSDNHAMRAVAMAASYRIEAEWVWFTWRDDSPPEHSAVTRSSNPSHAGARRRRHRPGRVPFLAADHDPARAPGRAHLSGGRAALRVGRRCYLVNAFGLAFVIPFGKVTKWYNTEWTANSRSLLYQERARREAILNGRATAEDAEVTHDR